MIGGGVTYLRLVNDVIVVQVLDEPHETGHEMLSPGEEQSNAPKHFYVISLREVTAG